MTMCMRRREFLSRSQVLAHVTRPLITATFFSTHNTRVLTSCQGSEKPVFLKKAQPSGFFGVLLGFLDKQKK